MNSVKANGNRLEAIANRKEQLHMRTLTEN